MDEVSARQQMTGAEEDDHPVDRGTGRIKTLQDLKLDFSEDSSQSIYGQFGCKEKTFFKNQLKVLFTSWIDLTLKHNISYTLFAGSLLGAIRNGDMIPYDYDMDVLVDIKYFPLLESISEKRNFKPDGQTTHFVVQPGFNHSQPLNNLRFFTCDGRDVREMTVRTISHISNSCSNSCSNSNSYRNRNRTVT